MNLLTFDGSMKSGAVMTPIGIGLGIKVGQAIIMLAPNDFPEARPGGRIEEGVVTWLDLNKGLLKKGADTEAVQLFVQCHPKYAERVVGVYDYLGSTRIRWWSMCDHVEASVELSPCSIMKCILKKASGRVDPHWIAIGEDSLPIHVDRETDINEFIVRQWLPGKSTSQIDRAIDASHRNNVNLAKLLTSLRDAAKEVVTE